jgi:hypothetical protein
MTVEFDTAGHREEAVKLMSAAVETTRVMHGFEGAYYLDVDELHIVSVLMFDTEEDFLRATGPEYEALQNRARETGATFTRTDEYRVIASLRTPDPQPFGAQPLAGSDTRREGDPKRRFEWFGRCDNCVCISRRDARARITAPDRAIRRGESLGGRVDLGTFSSVAIDGASAL